MQMAIGQATDLGDDTSVQSEVTEQEEKMTG